MLGWSAPETSNVFIGSGRCGTLRSGFNAFLIHDFFLGTTSRLNDAPASAKAELKSYPFVRGTVTSAGVVGIWIGMNFVFKLRAAHPEFGPASRTRLPRSCDSP
jgi:hypothetical protein